jgi:hypothetical protein
MKREMISVGQWYLRPDTQETFQVVDCDDQSGTVRIQMFDGSLDEIEEDAWRALSPEPVEQPEDWTGPLDNLDTDDLEEFGAETDAEPEDYFRDDREPWKSLLDAEAMGSDGEQATLEEQQDERQWGKRLIDHIERSHRTVCYRAPGA